MNQGTVDGDDKNDRVHTEDLYKKLEEELAKNSEVDEEMDRTIEKGKIILSQ